MMMLRSRLFGLSRHAPASKHSLGVQMFGPSMRFFSADGADMVTFKIIDEQDDEHTIDGEVGQNMMQAGLHAKVPFLVACGGNAECCTCHCFFPKEVM